MFEKLEERRLLDASLNAGLLTVNGGAGADDIRLRIRSGNLIVSLKLQGESDLPETSFDASAVDQIVVNAGDGADLVLPGIELPSMTVNGGGGDDTLLGGNADDTLNGDGGNDYLGGQGGADEFNGGNGFDSADYR